MIPNVYITKIIDCQMSNNQANAIHRTSVQLEVKKNRDAEASSEVNPILFNKEPISKKLLWLQMSI